MIESDTLPSMKKRLLSSCLLSCLWLSSALSQTPTVADSPLPPARLSLPQLGLTADDQLTLAQERILGRMIWRDMRSEPDVIVDALVCDYLEHLIQRLAIPLGMPDSVTLRAFAVADPQLNAFAMPSGLMGIHSGLILSVAHDGELAAVMAHEIGHVSQRHFARGLANQKDNAWIGFAGFAAAVLAAKKGSAQADQIMQGAIAGSQALQASKQLSFSRDMEREADAVGFELMKQAKFDGSDMVRMLRRLGAASSLNETGTVYARSHPGATERMANIEGRLKIGSVAATRAPTGVNLDFLLFQARVRALTAKSAEQMDDARGSFQALLTAPSSTPLHKAALSIAGHYGLAMLASQSKQYDEAAQALAQAKHIPIAHPWLDVMAFELLAGQAKNASVLQVAQLIRQHAETAPATSAHAVALAQRSQALLTDSDAAVAQTFMQDWVVKHPQDDVAWGSLAALYSQQNQPAMALWAQAEQTAAMGVWASSINLLSQALRAGETTVAVATQNQWRDRLRELRQITEDEKTLLDKFK
jgi:beta-barrel assembly-enhancing protease